MPIIATKTEGAGANQDRVIVDVAGDRVLIVVADGAGGVTGSADAADAICARLRKRFREGGQVVDWRHELQELDAALAKTSTGGESTVVVVE